MAVPVEPKLYHIVHVDRLPSIIADGHLWSDAVMADRLGSGTTIGMTDIKRRRLNELSLSSHPGLYVGACVPFYFCPRSVMLYMLYQANHQELVYRGGQGSIVHLVVDLQQIVAWAHAQQKRWAFTLSNAGARYFEDRNDLRQLTEINWAAVQARDWQLCKEGKQAEFLLEHACPWHLIEHIGVHSQAVYTRVSQALAVSGHRPRLEIRPDWYYG
jgi:hypothetical protein